MKALSLFSGCGAMDLAAESAGIEIAGQCEIDKDCIKVLRHLWPGVLRWEDVRALNAQSLERKGVMPSEVDIIFGGFP